MPHSIYPASTPIELVNEFYLACLHAEPSIETTSPEAPLPTSQSEFTDFAQNLKQIIQETYFHSQTEYPISIRYWPEDNWVITEYVTVEKNVDRVNRILCAHVTHHYFVGEPLNSSA
jgi:hypothetical protein